MKFWLCGMTILMVMAAAIAPPAQSQTAQQAAANRVRPYNEGLAALSRFTADQKCAGDDVDAVRGSIDTLAKFEKVEMDMAQFQGARFLQGAAEHRERRLDLQFKLADTAKIKGCLDLADAQYRELINVYVGSAFGGIRDRARLSIDDIRDLRARK